MRHCAQFLMLAFMSAAAGAQEIEFEIVPAERVNVPVELERALELNPRAAGLWSELPPGRRRGFAHRVASAMRAETRTRRVEEVLDALVELAE